MKFNLNKYGNSFFRMKKEGMAAAGWSLKPGNNNSLSLKYKKVDPYSGTSPNLSEIFSSMNEMYVANEDEAHTPNNPDGSFSIIHRWAAQNGGHKPVRYNDESTLENIQKQLDIRSAIMRESGYATGNAQTISPGAREFNGRNIVFPKKISPNVAMRYAKKFHDQPFNTNPDIIDMFEGLGLPSPDQISEMEALALSIEMLEKRVQNKALFNPDTFILEMIKDDKKLKTFYDQMKTIKFGIQSKPAFIALGNNPTKGITIPDEYPGTRKEHRGQFDLSLRDKKDRVAKAISTPQKVIYTRVGLDDGPHTGLEAVKKEYKKLQRNSELKEILEKWISIYEEWRENLQNYEPYDENSIAYLYDQICEYFLQSVISEYGPATLMPFSYMDEDAEGSIHFNKMGRGLNDNPNMPNAMYGDLSEIIMGPLTATHFSEKFPNLSKPKLVKQDVKKEIAKRIPRDKLDEFMELNRGEQIKIVSGVKENGEMIYSQKTFEDFINALYEQDQPVLLYRVVNDSDEKIKVRDLKTGRFTSSVSINAPRIIWYVGKLSMGNRYRETTRTVIDPETGEKEEIMGNGYTRPSIQKRKKGEKSDPSLIRPDLKRDSEGNVTTASSNNPEVSSKYELFESYEDALLFIENEYGIDTSKERQNEPEIKPFKQETLAIAEQIEDFTKNALLLSPEGQEKVIRKAEEFLDELEMREQMPVEEESTETEEVTEQQEEEKPSQEEEIMPQEFQEKEVPTTDTSTYDEDDEDDEEEDLDLGDDTPSFRF